MNRYPEWTKQQLMLLWFWNKLQDAYGKGVTDLRVRIDRGGDQAGVYVWVPVDETEDVDPNIHSRVVNVSDEIPELTRGAEAAAVFDRLWREELIHATLGQAGSAVFYDLSNKGRVDIGKHPEQGRMLAAAFEEVLNDIKQDPSTTVSQRQSWLPTLVQVVTLLKNAPELGDEVLEVLAEIASRYPGS
jgi:hypothetical protein